MSLPTRMKGESEFFPHGYINGWAEHLISDIQYIHQGQGNYCRISALLAVLSFEAYLNYVGERLIEKWRERKSWRKKLELILKTFNASAALTNEPFTLLDDLFEYRNKFAHGCIAINCLDYIYYGGGRVEGEYEGDPQWYKNFGHKEQAEKTLRIIRDSMLAIQKLAEPNEKGMPWKICGSKFSSEVTE